MVKNYQGGMKKTCVLHWHINMRMWGDKTSTHLLRELRGNFFSKRDSSVGTKTCRETSVGGLKL